MRLVTFHPSILSLMVGMRFLNTSGAYFFSSEMSFNFPVWYCSRDWLIFFFCLFFFCGPVGHYKLDGKQLAEKEAPPPAAAFGSMSIITGIFFFFVFCWQALFYMGRTACYSVSQLFTCHNIKMTFSKFVLLLKKKRRRLISYGNMEWTNAVYCPVNFPS